MQKPEAFCVFRLDSEVSLEIQGVRRRVAGDMYLGTLPVLSLGTNNLLLKHLTYFCCQWLTNIKQLQSENV